MNRYIDFFLIALAVFGAAALIFNVHKYGLDPTLAAIMKALGIAEKAVVVDAESIATKVEGLFTKHTAAVVAAVKTAAPPAPVPVPPVAAVPLAGAALQDAIEKAEAAIQAWLAPAINYALVSAAELTAIYKAAIGASNVTYMDYTTGAISFPNGGSPSPNFAIQGKFLTAWLHPGAGFPMPTESERAYVGYNDTSAGSISAHFIVAADGTVTAR